MLETDIKILQAQKKLEKQVEEVRENSNTQGYVEKKIEDSGAGMEFINEFESTMIVGAELMG